MFADDTTIPLPALYVEAVDPTTTYTDGRSFVKRMWLDTSTGTIGTLKKRNAANDGWDTLIDLDAPAVTVHAASHQNGGADEINVAGLSGVLADPQVPITENVQDIAGTMLTDSSTIDFSYDDGLGTATATILAAGARAVLLDMQRWTISFTANGDAYIPADVAMTIDAGVAAIGTGTLAYEKSTTAAPSTFASTTLPATLQAGAWLKVTVSAITGFKAVELKRTA